jgi:hypothetical protein
MKNLPRFNVSKFFGHTTLYFSSVAEKDNYNIDSEKNLLTLEQD